MSTQWWRYIRPKSSTLFWKYSKVGIRKLPRIEMTSFGLFSFIVILVLWHHTVACPSCHLIRICITLGQISKAKDSSFQRKLNERDCFYPVNGGFQLSGRQKWQAKRQIPARSRWANKFVVDLLKKLPHHSLREQEDPCWWPHLSRVRRRRGSGKIALKDFVPSLYMTLYCTLQAVHAKGFLFNRAPFRPH